MKKPTKKPRKEPKFFLSAKPKRPAKWWPREGRLFCWVGILKDGGGWQVGQGDAMTRAEIRLTKELVEINNPVFREAPAN